MKPRDRIPYWPSPQFRLVSIQVCDAQSLLFLGSSQCLSLDAFLIFFQSHNRIPSWSHPLWPTNSYASIPTKLAPCLGTMFEGQHIHILKLHQEYRADGTKRSRYRTARGRCAGGQVLSLLDSSNFHGTTICLRGRPPHCYKCLHTQSVGGTDRAFLIIDTSSRSSLESVRRGERQGGQ